MKGKIYKGNIAEKADELTGVKVTRLSDNTGDTYHPYFTQQLIDLENETIIVLSTRTGSHQLYRMNLDNGDMLQLTDIKNGEQIRQPVLDITNNIVYFFTGRTLKSVRLDSLKEEELLEIPKGFHLGDMSITNKGDYLAFSYVEDIECMTQSGIIYSDMRERLHRHPSSVVVRYDIAKKQPYVVWGEHQRISHTNISPVDPNYILFCHEGSWQSVQRMWIAKVDTDEVYPLIVQRHNLDRVGHEFFTASGRIVTQHSYRYNVESEFFLQGEIFVNVDGSNERRYYYQYKYRPNHIQLNYAEDMGVGDCAAIKRDMIDDSIKYMSLLKFDDYRVTVGLLCKHDTSWLQQHTHPHPIFTRDDKHVIFASDAGGHTNIYKAEANWDKCLKSE